MQLNHMQRLSVIFKYFHKITDGDLEHFSLLCNIDKDIVLKAFQRESAYLSIHERFFICANLNLSGFIWSENFQSEEQMFKSLINRYEI